MNEPSISALSASEQGKALATLTSAFLDDPVERWLYPDEDQYLENFPSFTAALGAKAFDQPTAWGLDGCRAVALWLPPGVAPDEQAVLDILTGTVSPTQHEDMFAVLEQMAAAHPSDPHWYLAWLGVDVTGAAHAGTCPPLTFMYRSAS